MAEGGTNAQNVRENETGAINIGHFILPITVGSTSTASSRTESYSYLTNISKSIENSIEIYDLTFTSGTYNSAGSIPVLRDSHLNMVLRGIRTAMHGYPQGKYTVAGYIVSDVSQRIFSKIFTVSSNGVCTVEYYSSNASVYINNSIPSGDAICVAYITKYEVA